MSKDAQQQNKKLKPSDFFFEKFDPLNDEIEDLNIPDTYAWFMHCIILRARTILNNRNHEEIYFATDTLDFIASHAQHELSMKNFSILSKSDNTPIAMSRAMSYYNYIPLFDISNQDNFNNATWPEYFAVLALASIGSVINAFNRPFKDYEKQVGIEIEVTREKRAYEYSLDATEAISYAECLQGETHRLNLDIEAETNKKVSLQNKKAAIARFAPKNTIKDRFVVFYKNNKFSNKNEAARQYYRQLKDDEKKLFRKDTYERNLTEHLRKALKE